MEADRGEADGGSELVLLPMQGKKNTLLNEGSGSKKRSWTKNLQQLLEVPASGKIKQSCVLFHKAYI